LVSHVPLNLRAPCTSILRGHVSRLDLIGIRSDCLARVNTCRPVRGTSGNAFRRSPRPYVSAPAYATRATIETRCRFARAPDKTGGYFRGNRGAFVRVQGGNRAGSTTTRTDRVSRSISPFLWRLRNSPARFIRSLEPRHDHREALRSLRAPRAGHCTRIRSALCLSRNARREPCQLIIISVIGSPIP